MDGFLANERHVFSSGILIDIRSYVGSTLVDYSCGKLTGSALHLHLLGMCGGFCWKQTGWLVTLCIAVSLCVVVVLAKCVHMTEVGIVQCADVRVVNVALVALYGLSIIGVAALFWCIILLCRNYSCTLYVNLISKMVPSTCTRMRGVLMYVLASFQCPNCHRAVRTSLQKKLMRSRLLPQQTFFLMFTSVYTLMAVWLKANDTARGLHGGTTSSGI